MVNRKMKPIAHSMGVRNEIDPPHMVAIQEKILMPVGTAMTMVEKVKKACVSTPMPATNIWCAHTTKPMTPIAMMA